MQAPPQSGGGHGATESADKNASGAFFLSSPHAGPPHKGGGHGATESADKNASGAFFLSSPHAGPPPKGGGSWCYGECRQKCQWH